MFELESYNIAKYNTLNWRERFSTVEKAKKWAEKDHGRLLSWKKDGEYLRTGDLGYVMYFIKPIRVKS